MALICLGQIATAQTSTHWFFNNDCVVMKNLISDVRETPLQLDYSLSAVAKNNLSAYLKTKDISSGYRAIIIVNGFTERELLDNLLKSANVDMVLNTEKKVGIYVARTDFYGRELFYLYFVIPHTDQGIYSRNK